MMLLFDRKNNCKNLLINYMSIKESMKKKNQREYNKQSLQSCSTNSETFSKPSANRIAILHSIFDSFKESPESEWPIDAYQAIRTRRRGAFETDLL
ncbi:hypothetical protein NUSPORA_01572 [Nucleospora cyclopteri]